MANQQPIDHFLRELGNPNGLRSLDELRGRLDPTRQGRRLHKLGLGSRSKTFKVYTVEAVEQTIVVKFNPCGERDPFIDDVKKEYRILTKLPRGAAPEPLFCSTTDEEAITGTEFMVMTFIDGPNFKVVGEIPEGMVVQVHVTAMKKLAEVHAHVLRDRLVAKHEDTEPYWQEVVDSYLRNYRSTVGWLRWLFGTKMFGVDKESCLFSEISRGTKPNSRDRVSVIHGNLDIGNFVFNEEMTEVRAILNFKYEMNGDPIMDVASLLLSFMDRGDYSAKSEMVYHATDKDISEVVEAYRQNSIKEFSDEELAFGRAVCCLRHLCIYKRGIYDGFRDHESGVHKEIAEKATIVLDLLHRQGEAAYRAFTL